MEKLITYSNLDYEKLIFELSQNPKKITELKNQLRLNRNNLQLFNTKSYVLSLEKSFKLIVENKIDNKNNQNIFL